MTIGEFLYKYDADYGSLAEFSEDDILSISDISEVDRDCLLTLRKEAIRIASFIDELHDEYDVDYA